MKSYALRLPDHLMEQARDAAAEDEVSIDQMLISIIAEGLGHRRDFKMMRDRAARADMGSVMAILDRIPDVPSNEGDETPGNETSSGLGMSQPAINRPSLLSP